MFASWMPSLLLGSIALKSVSVLEFFLKIINGRCLNIKITAFFPTLAAFYRPTESATNNNGIINN